MVNLFISMKLTSNLVSNVENVLRGHQLKHYGTITTSLGTNKNDSALRKIQLYIQWLMWSFNDV